MSTTCTDCGAAVPSTSADCPQCGQASARTCSACGYPCEAGFTFCPRCGARRRETVPADADPAIRAPADAGAGRDADRRRVTVVFADLCGFTALAEHLDPETLRAFQNALFAALAEAIARYDGFVEKFVGDAVMAVFGAPRAHEDDPARALLAAEELLRRADALGRAWSAPLGHEVALHIGVHTGAVVAGSLGSGTGAAYAVTGDTVNTASRLLAAAGPGTVLVSAATRALTQDRFAFGPGTELAVRGRQAPLRVHRLLGARGGSGPVRGLEALGLAAPLVGREAAIEALLAAFDRLGGGRAQVVRVVGEAGVGKSRLLAEVRARLERDGRLAAATLRMTACSSLGEPTYGTFAALFRDAYRVAPDDPIEVARDKLRQGMRALGADSLEADGVAQVLGCLLGLPAAGPGDIAPEQLHRQITMAARALLERRLARQPLVVVVDDLQWADAASVELLSTLADQLAVRPLMLVLSQRPDAPPWRGSLAELTTIELGPLDGVQARSLVDRLLGAPVADAAGRGLRDRIAARAGGNPLFVEEIVRHLVGSGALAQCDGRWVCGADGAAADVPPTLYGLLLSRLDRLAEADRRLVQAAAVLGSEFEAALLARVAGEPAATGSALARLADAGLLCAQAQAPGRWRFTHALLHEVVYQNLLLARRTDLHGRAGRALEAALDGGAKLDEAAAVRPPQRLAELEALGHHWSLSADKLRGARYLLAAADWARAVYANDDALRHCERALRTLLDAAPAVPAAEAAAARTIELDVRERIADLLALQGRRADALAGYEAVRQAAAQVGDPSRAARQWRKLGGLHWEVGERERADACFAAGLAGLGDAGDPIERAHLLQEMGRLAFRAGDNPTAVALAERALQALPPETAGDGTAAGEVRAAARNTLGIALARLGRTDEAVRQIEVGVAQAESRQLLQAACRGYANLGVLYATLDPGRSIDTCLRGLAAARTVGDLGLQSRLYTNLAVAYCALTDRCPAEGMEAAQTAVGLDRRLGLLDHLAVPLVVLGQIHQCHGDRGRAFAAYREALELAERIDEPQLLFPCYDGLATLYLDVGRPAEAEAYLARAQAVCERAGVDPDALMTLPFLC